MEDTIHDASPPIGVQPALWELKLGQYVAWRLTLEQMRGIVDGWLSWPAFPNNYSGSAFTYAYFEGVEGEWRADPALCLLRCGVGVALQSAVCSVCACCAGLRCGALTASI